MAEPYTWKPEWLALQPEDAIDPELPIIDPHHHLWDAPGMQRYLLQDLRADTGSGHNVEATVFIDCMWSYRRDVPKEMRQIGETERAAAEARLSALLPAEKASAEAALAQAEADLAKTVVRAGVDGRVEQFALRVGDVVNPLMRPAGVLIPEGAGRGRLVAGFGQVEAQVMQVGMVAEATCASRPWTIIPMVVTEVQDFIAAGQFRGGEQLIDPQQVVQPGTILVILEPLYEGGLDDVTPGSSCIANAYTSNHDLIASGNLGATRSFVLHAVDAVGLVHALILRIQALVYPIQTLVGGGH